MKRVMVILLIWGSFLLAENSAPPAAAPAPGVAPFGAPPKGIEVFDKDFWNPAPRPAAPTVSKEGRSYAAEPDYNTDQLQQWKDTCEPIKEQDGQAYRDCFNNEKAKSKRAQRQEADDVEKRQSQPMGGKTIPLYEQSRANSLGDD